MADFRLPRRSRLGCLGRAAITLLVTAFILVLMFEPMLRSMLYPAPSVPVPEPPPGITEDHLDGLDGARLVVWSGPASEPPPGRPAVDVFHGNGENLATMQAAGFFHRMGELDVAWLAVDYPGYGRSTGEPSEESLVAGGQVALDWLRRFHPDRPVVVLGWSLGAAVAAQLAAGEAAGAVDGLILLSPWSRLEDVAAAHFPALLVRPVVGGRYDSLAVAGAVQAPALVVHGARDRIIPVDQGRQVMAALEARSGVETRRLEVTTAGHNDLLAHDEPWRAMEGFLESLAGEEGRDETRDVGGTEP